MTDEVTAKEEMVSEEAGLREPVEASEGSDAEAGVDASDVGETESLQDDPALDDPFGGASAEVEAEAEPEGGDPSDDQETELVALREQFETLNDRHLRLAAEFNNFRRRTEQERLGAWARAQAELAGSFLDVLDDIQRVAELDLSNATVEAIMEGIDLVERKFVRVLGDAAVEVIDPVGEPFDPETMEAMMRVPSEDEAQVDTVAQVFQKGYQLKGVLIRPARVSVHTQG